MTGTSRAILLLATALLTIPTSILAKEDGTSAEPRKTARIASGVSMEAYRIGTDPESGTITLEGAVTIVSGQARFQADRVVLREERFLEAEGNVLVVWGANRISGARMTYDLETDRGVVEEAMGNVEPEFYFRADEVAKIGEDRVRLRRATVTTCTQPIPYWSFSVSSARVRVDHYARMRNLRLRFGRVPVLYLPYMVWPVKPDRAAGLLFPKFGTTRNRGRVFTQALFVPFGRSADMTAFAEYYTLAGWGGGGQFRIVPNRSGEASLSAFYIDDQVAGFGRWRATYKQTQTFLNGFRLVADVNQVSDFAYFTDYERELSIASSPTILGRIEMSRNGSWTSMNLRELRREQLFSDGTSLVQRTLPEIEWRGRSRRLGRSPFYVSFESSLASIQQRSARIDADYRRVDMFPTLSLPWSPSAWLDVNPSVSYRLTHWTQSRDSTLTSDGSVGVEEESLTRSVAGASIEIVGPKFFRIFDREGSEFSTQYKHTIEPRIAWEYQEGFDDSTSILSYDEVDRSIGDIDRLSYGLQTRLYAKRPRSSPDPAVGEGEAIVLPDGTVSSPESEDEEDGPGGDEPAVSVPTGAGEPVEIASLEVRQTRSFDRFQNTEDLDGDGVLDPSEDLNGDGVLQKSRTTPVDVIGRFNPSRKTSLDLRAQYDFLFDTLSSLSLSGNLRGEKARLSFSLVRNEAIRVGIPDRTQVTFGSGVSLFGGKLRMDFDGSYDFEEGRLPDQRLRMEYYTQCCGFLAEYLRRDFLENARNEFRFTIDLRGIGKLLDLHEGTDD